MSSSALITIVIPTYRRPRLLRRAVLSVLGQRYSHVRVCIWDNASGDETEATVAEMFGADSRVQYYRREKNIGFINNLNHGLTAVKTPYFCVLGDDDVLLPWFLESAMSGFAQYPDTMFSALDSIKVDAASAVMAGSVLGGEGGSLYFTQGQAFGEIITGRISVPWGGTVFRREVLEALGVPNPNAGPNINDYFILRAAARYACVVSPVIGCAITEHASSLGARTVAVSPDWQRWHETIQRDILADAEVTHDVHVQVQKLFVLNLRHAAFRQVVQGLGCFGHRGFLYARQAARGVGECGHLTTSAMLKTLVWAYSNCAPIRLVFGYCAAARKRRTSLRRVALAKRYAHLMEYLRPLEAPALICPPFSIMQPDARSRIVEQPLVTTVIPTYCRPGLLRRAILSVLGQTYPHVRVCVSDNASGDETEAVVAELARRDSRVQYHRHQENIGSYGNFNYGIQCVETPYFSLLSDDDVLTPDFYSQAMMAFDRYPDAMFVCMPTLVVDVALRIISPPTEVDAVRYFEKGEAVKGMLEGTVPGTWTGIVFRSEVRGEVGHIDAAVGPHADGGFVYHVAARFPGVALPGVAAVLMAHENSVSGTSVPLSGEWIGWWDSMMRRIFEDGNVPAHIQDYVRKVSPPNYLLIGAKQVAHALVGRHFTYASRAARGVKECGHPLVGTSLSLLIWCCKYFRADTLLMQLKRTRDVLQRRRRKNLDARHGGSIDFMRQYVQDEAQLVLKSSEKLPL